MRTTAGNHEAWRKGTAAGGSALLVSDPTYKRPDNRMASDSVAKLVEVVDCARRCGVYVGPLRVVLGRDTATTGTANSSTATSSITAATAESGTENANQAVGTSSSGMTTRSQSSSSNKGSADITLSSLHLEEITPTVSTDSSAVASASVAAPATGTVAPEVETAVVIMPLYGWYHSSWDSEPEITDPQFVAAETAVPFARKWGDYSMCTWPGDILSHDEFIQNPVTSTTLAETFAKLNEPFLHPPPYRNKAAFASCGADVTGVADVTVVIEGQQDNTDSNGGRQYFGSPIAKSTDTIISYSHYLPRLELCPEKRFLTEPLLSKVIGRYGALQQQRWCYINCALSLTYLPLKHRLAASPSL